MSEKRHRFNCIELTFEQEDRLVLMTERGLSARQIAEELNIPADRVASERARLQVRGHNNGPVPSYDPLRPNHVSRDPFQSAEWWRKCDLAFRKVMAPYMVEYYEQKGLPHIAARWAELDPSLEAAE